MGTIRRIGGKKITQLKQHLKDPLYKNSYYLMVQTITGAGGGFIFWLFAAWFFSENTIGLGSAIISGMNLLIMMSILGFNIGIIAYLPHEEDKNRMINSCLSIVGITAFILAIIFIIGIDIWSPALSVLKEPRYLVLFIVFTIIASLFRIQGNIFIAFRNAKYSFIQSFIAISRVALLPLVISLSVFGLFFSYGFGVVLAFIVGNILITRVYPKYKPKPGIDKRMIKNMFWFSFGNYIAVIFANLPNSILPLIVINVLGAKMNAYFYIAWMFSGILLMIPRAISTSLFAEGSYDPKALRMNTRHAMRLIFLLLIPLVIGISYGGNYILLIFGEAYSKNAFEMLLILAIASIPYSFNVLYITIKRVQKQVMPIIYVHSFITLFTIITGYILIQNMGLIGIGISWLSAQSITSVFVMIVTVRERFEK